MAPWLLDRREIEHEATRVVGFPETPHGDLPQGRTDVLPSYDQKQAAAVLIVRPCCQRPVYATNPNGRCASCR